MVSDLKTFANKGCKISAQIKGFFRENFALLSRIFLVSMFLTLFNGLCAPTSQRQMSKLFRFSEFLGKSNGKKWSQIWKLLLKKDVKLPQQKSFFLPILFCICSLYLNIFFPQNPWSPMSKHLKILNPWEKVMERSGLRF